jgi:hypothetical protein
MAITAAFCSSYKEDLFNAVHTSGASYKIALYTSSATLDATTTQYTASNEVANGNGYTTTGQVITTYTVSLSGTTSILDFTTDPTWPTSTITARGAMIYNDTHTQDKSLCILDFGADISSSNGTFTVTFPAATATQGLMRIA